MNTKRELYLKKTYHITPAIYQEMLDYNDGGCHICSRKPKTGKNLNVDHDHKTGENRGLLCFFCNKYMIGRRRREHAKLFEMAAKYLRRVPNWGFAPIKVKGRKK